MGQGTPAAWGSRASPAIRRTGSSSGGPAVPRRPEAVQAEGSRGRCSPPCRYAPLQVPPPPPQARACQELPLHGGGVRRQPGAPPPPGGEERGGPIQGRRLPGVADERWESRGAH
ncbi:unnamed protein product [Musa hybrid cultivar]